MMVQRGKRVGKQTLRQQPKRSEHKAERKANKLLCQVIASALIFLLVFVGGGLIPDHIFDVMGTVRQTINGESNLLEAVEALGNSISSGENWKSALKEWCVDAFWPVSEATVGEHNDFDYFEASEQYHLYLFPDGPYAPEKTPIDEKTA